MMHTKPRHLEILPFLLVLILAGLFAWSAYEPAEQMPQIPTTVQEPTLTAKPTLPPPTTTQATTIAVSTSTEAPTQPSQPPLFDLEDPCLRLVSRASPLPEDYAPELVQIGELDRHISVLAYDALCQMLADGRQEGLYFHIASAYRSTQTQTQLFEEDVNRRMARGMSYEEAYADTALYTMPPGCSEHESGLALDIVAVANQNLDDSQQYTPETQWLNAHCHEYGFILRYPQDKTDITGIAHESWHYRYVGLPAALYIHEHGLTLEEFIAAFES